MENDSPTTDVQSKTIRFRYLKSGAFRVIHADGAWGGITPRADIHMILYSERPSIPDAILHEVTPEGHLGNAVVVEGRGGPVREVEADIVMNLATARALLDWLSKQVRELEDILEVPEEVEQP